MPDETLLRQAVEALAKAEALVVTAGAGMGVDSGLPDFRGTQGFWKAYPPYQKLGLDFPSLANPRWFARDPALAWGFYGHRLNLYRAATPHAGFQVLRRWAERMPCGAFVFTSNVDGHFQRVGFAAEQVAEVHGSVLWLQCTGHCGAGIVPTDAVTIDIDEATMRAREPLPHCTGCGALARPNILMFGDWDWDSGRTDAQLRRLEAWLGAVADRRLVVVECGAGQAIPTVRHFSEQLVAAAGATLIRINLREPDVPDGQIGLALGALAALESMAARA